MISIATYLSKRFISAVRTMQDFDSILIFILSIMLIIANNNNKTVYDASGFLLTYLVRRLMLIFAVPFSCRFPSVLLILSEQVSSSFELLMQVDLVRTLGIWDVWEADFGLSSYFHYIWNFQFLPFPNSRCRCCCSFFLFSHSHLFPTLPICFSIYLFF